MHGIRTVGWEQEIKLHSQRSPDSREQSKKSVSPNYNIEKRVDNYMALSLTLVAGLVPVRIGRRSRGTFDDGSTRSSEAIPVNRQTCVMSVFKVGERGTTCLAMWLGPPQR